MATDTLLEQVVTVLQTLEPFPVGMFMHRVYNKTRQVSDASTFRKSLPVGEAFGAEPNSLRIAGQDESDILTDLTVQSVISAVVSLDNAMDKPNFRASVKPQIAKRSTLEDMTELVALLFTEHIDWKLADQGIPSLATLAGTEGLLKTYQDLITDPKSINGKIATDLHSEDHTFSMAILFVYAYLHHGPGFAPYLGDEFKSAPACRVLTTWSSTLLDSQSRSQPVGVDKVFQFSVKVASLIWAPVVRGRIKFAHGKKFKKLVMDSTFKPAVKTVEGAALSKSARVRPILSDNDLSKLVNNRGATDSFRSIASQCQAYWNLVFLSKWVQAVASLATQVTQSTRNRTASPILNTSPFAVLQFDPFAKRTIEITTSTGRRVADWVLRVKKSYPQLFTKKLPKVISVENRQVPPQPSCFISGTLVTTDIGRAPIEDITEGTRILTDAPTGRTGVASDEEVKMSVSEPLLVGFNGDSAFSTLGHVFHTTTGLRAVEPDVAKEENPWIEVGKLEPGHVLYKLSADGNSYDLVPIDLIHIQQADSQSVHGIHLREGERRYHANGYLVAVNYPEITIKSVAAALEKPPKTERVNMLAMVMELKPVFIKLGLTGVEDLISHEIKQAKAGRLKTLRQQKGIPFLDMRRTLVLEPGYSPLTDKHGPPGYELPIVNIFDGTVSIDDKAVQRVFFDPIRESIHWSRELADFGYEHGIMNLFSYGLTGQGAVWITEEENPADMPKDLAIIVPFSAKKANIVPKDGGVSGKSEIRLEGARVMRTAGVAPQARKPFMGNFLTRLRKRLRELLERIKNQLAEQEDEDLGSGGDGEESEDKDGQEQEGGEEEDEDADEDEGEDDHDDEDHGSVDPVDEEDYYATYFDEEPWPKDTQQTACKKPARWEKLALATYHTRQENGFKLPTLVLPTFDRLQEDINSKRSSEMAVGPLYSSGMTKNPNGTLHARVKVDEAASISSLSDQYTIAENEEEQLFPTRNLTFQKHQSSIQIPFLFAEAEIDFAWHFREFNGAVWDYKPEMTANPWRAVRGIQRATCTSKGSSAI